MSARHVIVVGFGLSGRAAANVMEEQNISVSVIEMNTEVVSRCAKAGLHIIEGDAREEDTLRHAGKVVVMPAQTGPQETFDLDEVRLDPK